MLKAAVKIEQPTSIFLNTPPMFNKEFPLVNHSGEAPMPKCTHLNILNFHEKFEFW